MSRFNTLILLLLATILTAVADPISPDALPKPARGMAISDVGGYLTPEQTAKLNDRMRHLDEVGTVGMYIAIVPDIGDFTPAEYATTLFDRWKPGHGDIDNGLILLVAMQQRQAFICTGSGMEGILPDAICNALIRKTFVPQMKRDNLYGAIDDTVTALTNTILHPDNRDEVRSNQNGSLTPLSSFEFWQIVFWICSALFLFTTVLFIITLINSRRKSNYEKAILWRNAAPLYWWCVLFTGGASIIYALLATWLKHYYRNKQVTCDTCGAKMNKLNEEEDNTLLSPSQDLEERLDTVDYDVWLCPHCGTVERFPFKQKQSEYSECPKCHTIAMHLVCDRVFVQPTIHSYGQGIRYYKCEYCDNQIQTPYRIDKKPDPTAAIVAGAALGAATRGGGGSGGGWSGPSFGGGTSGGGGGAGW